jgi:hypothetical protein
VRAGALGAFPQKSKAPMRMIVLTSMSVRRETRRGSISGVVRFVVMTVGRQAL